MAGNYSAEDFAAAGVLPQEAIPSLAAAQGVSPQAANDALQNDKKVGIPASVGMPDPTVGNDMAAAHGARAIYNTSPHVKNYLDNAHPAKVAVVQHDLSGLAQIGSMLDGWGKSLSDSWGEAWKGYGGPVQSIAETVGPAIEKLKTDTASYYASQGRGDGGLLGGERALAGLAGDVFGGVVGGGTAAFLDPAARLEASVPLPMWATPTFRAPHLVAGTEARYAQARQDVGNLFGAALFGFKGKGTGFAGGGRTASPPYEPPPASSPGHIPTDEAGYVLHPDGSVRSFADQRSAGMFAHRTVHEGSDQIFDMATHPTEDGRFAVQEIGRKAAPEVPPAGVHPETDAVRTAIADADAAHVANVQETVADNATHKLSPATLEEYMRGPTEGKSVWIGAQALAKVQSENIDKGLGLIFGDHSQKLLDALQNGGDVEIPLSQYISETAGQPFASVLNTATRFRVDGVSQDEGKDLADHHDQMETPIKMEGVLPQEPRGISPGFHTQLGETGRDVAIHKPSVPTAYTEFGKATELTLTPHSALPASVNGVGFKSWTPPTDWHGVSGTKEVGEPAFDKGGMPYQGSGIIMREPDGRIWLVSPTNDFGGDGVTFPKGKLDEWNMSLQENAIKEVYEETGLKARITHYVGDFKRFDSMVRVYAGERETGHPHDMSWESQALHLVSPKRAFELMKNKVEDHPILAAMLAKTTEAPSTAGPDFSKVRKLIADYFGSELDEQQTPLAQYISDIKSSDPNFVLPEEKAFTAAYDAAVAAKPESIQSRVLDNWPEDIPESEKPYAQSLAAKAEGVVDEIFQELSLSKLLDAKTLGLTAKEFETYSLRMDAEREAMSARIIARIYKELRRYRTKEWKAAYDRNYSRIEKNELSRRDVQALTLLREKAGALPNLVKDMYFVENGKPITFYHGSAHKEISKFFIGPHSQYPVISFTTHPKFADRQAQAYAGVFQEPPPPLPGKEVSKGYTYIVHIAVKNGRVGDYRNPEHVAKAAQWFVDKGIRSSIVTASADLRRGDWSMWEKPEMAKDLGWDATVLMESPYNPTPPAFNIGIWNGDFVHFKFDGPKVKFSLSVLKNNPEAAALPRAAFSKNGLSADEVADHFSFDSGEAMIRELAALERARGKQRLNTYILSGVQRMAVEAAQNELGFNLNKDDMMEAAKNSAQLPQLEDALIEQLRQMSPQPITKEALRADADRRFEALPVRRAKNVKEIERTLARAGRAAERGFLKGDTQMAFHAKQVQVLNLFQLQRAHKLAKSFSGFEKRVGKWARNPIMKRQDQEHLNIIRSVLEDTGRKVSWGKYETAKQALGSTTLESFLDSLFEDGHEPAQADVLPAPQGKWDNYTVAQWTGLRDMLTSIANLGVDKQKAFFKAEGARLTDIAAEIKANADALGRKFTPGEMREQLQKRFTGLGAIAREVGAAVVRQEVLLAWLDQQGFGPFAKYLMQGLQDAKYLKGDLSREFTAQSKEFVKTLPKGWEDKLEQNIVVPELKFGTNTQGAPVNWIFKRSQLMKLVLNAGTDSGYEKLLGGFDWDEGLFWQVVNRELNEPFYWEMIAHTQAQYAALKPRIQATYRRVVGLGLKMEKPRPIPYSFTTPDGMRVSGSIPGGYFPIDYDYRAFGTGTTSTGEKVIRNPQAKSAASKFGKDYRSAYPPNKYTLQRTGFKGPLDSNWSSIYKALEQHVHDVAYRAAIIQAARVLKMDATKNAIQDVLGPEYVPTFDRWLTDVAREEVFDAGQMSWAAARIRGLRFRFTKVQIGWNVRTVIKHSGIAAAHVSTTVGPKYLVRAINDLHVSPAQQEYWSDFTIEKFGEVRNALVNVDRDIKESMRAEVEKRGALSWYSRNAFLMFGRMKQLEAKIVALAMYRRALEENPLDEERAVYLANQAVRNTQGAAAQVDLPGLYRQGSTVWAEIAKLTYLFTSFENTTANRNWIIKRTIGKVADNWQDGGWAGNKRDIQKIAQDTLGYNILPWMWLALLGGGLFSQPKNWKEFEAAALDSGLKAMTTSVVGGVVPFADKAGELPFLIYELATHPKHTVHTAKDMLGSMTEDAISGYKGVRSLADHKVHAPHGWVEHAFNTAGYLSGYPTKPVSHAAQYMWDLDHHAVKPNVIDGIKDVAFGEPGKAKK